MNIQSNVTLNNGVEMPWLGLGVFKAAEGKEVQNAVHAAVECGYRSIDTAAVYRNEEGVGSAVKNCGMDRDELFITTKVWNTEQGYDTTLNAFNESMKKLKMDYLDLYLIHWVVKDKYLETWKALEKLYQEGYVKAIGVSNFLPHHLDGIFRESEIVPAVNQVQFHPYHQQPDLLSYCKSKQIQMEAWSPFAQGKSLHDPVLQSIADKHGKNVAQVILRWDLQSGVVTIPKSIKPERIRSNADIFDFQLDEEDLEQIAKLNRNERLGPDPDHVEF
ncbi:aldo/keto reductase [Chengkuizengella axinellae]|uniref:Aldo/keto reductase n=1 Tax=Chengkuizengella axinellae TaxID=3064388 RepID=A0ABT9IWI8_9BACL|nr:aldo/keto reductase [Chengkuizengella sp. 2205SS18-9]MDP5273730.1 aldo/keto reductase [Chengkuizengella sp. 2205SS18-9]